MRSLHASLSLAAADSFVQFHLKVELLGHLVLMVGEELSLPAIICPDQQKPTKLGS